MAPRPRAKARAYTSRSGDRAKAVEACRHLQAQRPVNRTELEERATRAAELTPTTVARVAKILRHSLPADCVTAPFEEDSQLKVMENLYSRSEQRCFVRANYSDLTVHGVRSVLWDVNMEDGGLFGQHASVWRPFCNRGAESFRIVPSNPTSYVVYMGWGPLLSMNT